MTGSDLAILVEFHLENSTPTINVIDRTDYEDLGISFSTVVGTLRVYDPNNNLIYDNLEDYSSPDIDLSTTRKSGGINLTTNDDTGEVVSGVYQLIYKIQEGSNEHSNTFNTTYSYTRPTVDISVTVDGFASTYESLDSTTYNAEGEDYMDFTESTRFTVLPSARPYEGTLNVADGSKYVAGDVVVVHDGVVANGDVCYVKSSAATSITVHSGVKLNTSYNTVDSHTLQHYSRREHSVTPPTGSGMSSLSGSNETQSYTPNIYSGSYVSGITSDITEKLTTDVYVYEQVTGTSTDRAYLIDADNILAAISDLIDDYIAARDNNPVMYESLENKSVAVLNYYSEYDLGLRQGNNTTAYAGAIGMLTELSTYVSTATDPSEIEPFSDEYASSTDEKVKVNSSDTTSDYLINKMSSQFEVLGGVVTLKASAVSALADFVQQSTGGAFEGIISYSADYSPSGSREIPDIGWVEAQNYAALSDISTSGTLLSYDSGTGVISLDEDLANYDNTTAGFISGNETITLSGDVTGSGTTAITATIASGAVESSMLNSALISSLAATTNIDGTETLITDDSGLKKVTLSTINTYIGDNISLDHNDLSSLQGGDTDEYYHLSLDEYNAATRNATSSQSGLLTSTDWSTFNDKQDAITSTSSISVSGSTLSVNNAGIIDDDSLSTTALWSASKIISYVLGEVTGATTTTIDYIDARQDSDNPTTLDPGASPTEGDRYIITDPNNLNGNFGTIDTDINGDAIQLGAEDVVEYVDTGLSTSGSMMPIYEFRVVFDASSQTSTSDATVGTAIVDGETLTNNVWQYNGAVWVNTGSKQLHADLTDVLPSVSNQYHLTEAQYNGIADNDGGNADNFHSHDHNQLNNVLGSSEGYHLSEDQYNVQELIEFEDLGNKNTNFNISLAKNKRYKVTLTGDVTITLQNFAAANYSSTVAIKLVASGGTRTVTWSGVTSSNWLKADELTSIADGDSYEVVILAGNGSASDTTLSAEQIGT